MKKNMQFRMKIFIILFAFTQLTTREIYEHYLNENPKSVPPFNRFAQMMRHKWFENIGMSDSYGNMGRARNAIWEIKPIYREFPPQWTPSSGKILHQGGEENYPTSSEVVVTIKNKPCTIFEDNSPNIFDEYDDQLNL